VVEAVIRREKFTHSRAPYAVALDTFKVREAGTRPDGSTFYSVRVSAFWFRGRVSKPTANLGHLWDVGDFPTVEALLAGWDGRYGGACEARWDGTSLWGPDRPEDIARVLAALRPALEAYPAVPDGYDAWWYAR
jgi:hypothetical protein